MPDIYDFSHDDEDDFENEVDEVLEPVTEEDDEDILFEEEEEPQSPQQDNCAGQRASDSASIMGWLNEQKLFQPKKPVPVSGHVASYNPDPDEYLTAEEVIALGLHMWLGRDPVYYTRTSFHEKELQKIGKLHKPKVEVSFEHSAAELQEMPEHPWLTSVEDWLTCWSEEYGQRNHEAMVADTWSRISKTCLPRFTRCRAVIEGNEYCRYDLYKITEPLNIRKLTSGEQSFIDCKPLQADVATLPVGTEWFIWRIACMSNKNDTPAPSDYRFVVIIGESQGEEFEMKNFYFLHYPGLQSFLERSWLSSFGPKNGRMK